MLFSSGSCCLHKQLNMDHSIIYTIDMNMKSVKRTQYKKNNPNSVWIKCVENFPGLK